MFWKKKTVSVDNHEPGTTALKPITPFRVLHVDLPFYSDPQCEKEVKDARLVIFRCEDPMETIQVWEARPTTRRYQVGQIVNWGFNHKRMWDASWYRHPETGKIRQAFTNSAEFVGRVFVRGDA